MKYLAIIDIILHLALRQLNLEAVLRWRCSPRVQRDLQLRLISRDVVSRARCIVVSSRS